MLFSFLPSFSGGIGVLLNKPISLALALRAICGCRVARDSERPRLQLLYRKSYAEKVQEVEKDPKIPVSFRNAMQKIGITITGIISSEIVIIDFQ